MTERVNLSKAGPDLYKTVARLEELASSALASAGIAEGFAHLLRLRASQINHCAYCCRLHTRDALASGEPSDRIAVVPAWQESDYFTQKERAALELMEAITLIAQGQVPDDIYQRAAANLSKDEIAAVEWLGITINAWNRISIASRYSVKP